MIIKIQKFAKGGSQIGGRFADYSASYTPLDVEPVAPKSSTAASSKTNSSKSDALSLKDVLQVFDNVKGLNADVTLVMNDFAKIVQGELLTSYDGEISVSSLATKYLSNLAKFNALRNSKEEYDNIRTQLEKNNSLDEIAIDANGNLMALGEDGLDSITIQEYLSSPESYKVLTNHNLLDLRSKNPNFSFRDDLYSNISGIGMDSIIGKINNIVTTLGHTKKDTMTSEMRQMADGLDFIQKLNDEGQNVEQALSTMELVKQGLATEDQVLQGQQAISSILQTLTPQEQDLIAYHSVNNGGQGVVGFLTDLIGSKSSSSIKQTNIISRIWTPKTGTTSSKSNSKTGGDDEVKDEKSNPLMQMMQQQGGTYRTIQWITKDGTQSMGTTGVWYPELNNVKSDMSIEQMLADSGIGGILQSVDGITFGNQIVPSENLKDIMYDHVHGGYVAVLPCTTDVNGNKMVDLTVIDTYKQIVNSVTEPKGTQAWNQAVARKMKEKGLSQYLMGDGQLDDRRFGLFLMVDGVTTDRWKFNKDSKLVEKVNFTETDQNNMAKALSTNDKKDNYEIDIDDSWGPFEGTYDDVYKATVYIPLNYNINQAINSYGDQVNITSARSYERDYQDLYYRKVQDSDTNIGSDQLEQ